MISSKDIMVPERSCSFLVVRLLVFMWIGNIFISGCLITNCPRGGKRSGKFTLLDNNNIKQCISCGPGGTGQCFGSSICCGQFGCLIGSIPETLRCQRDGMFQDRQPCIAGTSNCRKNTGRCAADGVCCTQDSCYVDKECSSMDEKKIFSGDNAAALDILNMLGYQSDLRLDR